MLRRQHNPTPCRELSLFEGRNTRTITAGKEVPRTEIKIGLPQHFRDAAVYLDNLAARKAAWAYVKICRRLPSRFTVLELHAAKKIAEHPSFANEGLFRAKADFEKSFDVASLGFHNKGIHLEWYHLNDMRRFFSGRAQGEMEISVNGKRFIIRMEGGEVVAEHSIRKPLQESLSSAISIIHLRDMVQTCSLEAAVMHANSSRTLLRPGMLENLRLMFASIPQGDENPKMDSLARLLSERKGRRCLVVCETGEQKEVLCRRFPGAQVTNHPKKDGMAGFEIVILYNPTSHAVEAAWKSGVCEIIVLVAEGTIDEDKYWQNAKKEEAKKKPGIGTQLSLLL